MNNKNNAANGVLLMNMGGPGSVEEIEPYLYRLFSDPYIIGLPAFLRKPLAKLMASRRQANAAARYNRIGGKSPLLEETLAQARALENTLDLPVGVAMRYTRPFAADACRELEVKGVNRLLLLPLYPQYSYATTGSALEDFSKSSHWRKPYRIIETHYRHPLYIEAMTALLHLTLEKADPRLKTAVIFAAHSIPMKQVKAGDPYVDQVEATAAAIVAENSHFDHSLAYQSKLGPVAWQGPTLEEALQTLLAEKVEQVTVQPVSFVSENLETLYDLDIQFKDACRRAGIKNYLRVPAPGTDPKYIDALASLVKNEIQKTEAIKWLKLS